MKKVLWPLLLVLVYGCDIFDKEETIPGFVYIESSDLITDEETQGANTSNIYDATVYADGEFMGTFEMPAKVPILKNGNTDILVGAGIKNNGLGADRRIYPFYAFHSATINLQPNTVSPITADSIITYQYFPDLNFRIIGFETIGTQLEAMPTNTADFFKTTNTSEVLTGQGSLEINMTQEGSQFYTRTNWNLANLTPGASMYLEIDFKGDQYIEIGVLAQNPERAIFAGGINPTEEWTKVYIELTDEISPLFNADPLNIYFRSILNAGEPDKTMFMDNIKFITP
jgi:hypothetical protein